MKQEDRELLLRDLCARLPYHPKGLVVNACTGAEWEEWLTCATFTMFTSIINNCRLYLRPMSSITAEEKEELRQKQIKDEQLFADCIKNHPKMRGLIIPHFAADWCDKNMFDYRGLIEKGLAIAVTEENNPYEK